MTNYKGLIWKLAKNNEKLNKAIYKDILNRSPFIQEKMSLKKFKEAFHSPKTKTAYRALLLSSLYDKTLFRDQLLKHKPELRSKKLGLAVYQRGGSKFFNLVSSKHGFTKNVITPIKIPEKVKKNIEKYTPWGDDRRLVTRALRSGSVHAQKIALCVEEASTFLHSLADLLALNIRLNDPKKRYFSLDYSPNEFDDDTIDPIPGVGHLQQTQSKFLSHLVHMREQLEKFEPTLNRMGIETKELKEKLSALKYSVGIFTETEFLTVDEEMNKLYNYFAKSVDLLEDIKDVASDLENLSFTDPKVYSIGTNRVVPKYVPYSDRDKSYVDTNPKGYVTEAIREIMRMFER